MEVCAQVSLGRIILVKHAETLLVPEVSAEHWRLTEKGLEACGALAERLRGRGVEEVVASMEAKAIETGQLVARKLGVGFETAMNLHEHDRSNVPLVPREEFERRIGLFFAHPDRLVYGLETAAEARDRFRLALERVVREQREEGHHGTLAVVTHGTVIALLMAQANGVDGFELWKRLAMPSFVVAEQGTYRLLEVVGSVV